MKEQFTPGPWVYKGEVITVQSLHGDICDLVTEYNGKQMPFESNGFLISAAPELYSALKNLKECLESYFGKTEKSFFEDCEPEDDELFFAREYTDACNALEKARGEK